MAREELKDTIKNLKLLKSFHNGSYGSSIDEAINALEQEQTTEWISVSERLPEEDGKYLLFGKIDEDEDDYIFIGDYDACAEQFGIRREQFDWHTSGCLGSEFFEYASVLAWQPLPKAYQSEVSE